MTGSRILFLIGFHIPFHHNFPLEYRFIGRVFFKMIESLKLSFSSFRDCSAVMNL